MVMLLVKVHDLYPYFCCPEVYKMLHPVRDSASRLQNENHTILPVWSMHLKSPLQPQFKPLSEKTLASWTNGPGVHS